ncbi:MAG TPA: glycosyltransferase [Ktedonobacterales bacterium]|nr:glycosyltransferase [Ktedonobacterales bacterium]
MARNQQVEEPQQHEEAQQYIEAASKIVILHGQKFRPFAPFQQTLSAYKTLTDWQKVTLCAMLLGYGLLLVMDGIQAAILIIGLMTFLYLGSLFFSFLISIIALGQPGDEHIDDASIAALADTHWPRYTILCPLYRETAVVPQFVQAMQALDYPAEQLQILCLTEEEDVETRAAIKAMSLPDHFSVVTVPAGQPRTKPRACNFGLLQATGDYIVIYDAEDIPEPLQLKKAVLAFASHGPDLACVQAKLNYYNARQNVLTRLFTAEYSLWFDLVLPGMQAMKLPLPLGGTSNHFRAEMLRKVGAWDPFNVTEDCDLGLRLAYYHLKTAILDSTTYEEANSQVKNWIRQRSRWIKGYLQTYLVYMRQPLRFLREGRLREFFTLQLVIGGKTLVMLVNPLMWLLVALYFPLRPILGAVYRESFPNPVLYMGATCLIAGNFFYLYTLLIGCLKRGQYGLIKWSLLAPIYWAMMSIAAYKALFQLVLKPHYWEKTTHGLHLRAAQPAVAASSGTAKPAQKPAMQRIRLEKLPRETAAAQGIAIESRATTPLPGIQRAGAAVGRRSERQAWQRSGKDPWLFATIAVACIASIASCWYYFQHHDILLYEDAFSHLSIARRIFDSPTPGLAQVGGVWLPLPHLLMLPFIWNDDLWRTGLAGSFPSMLAYVVTSIYLYLAARRLTRKSVVSFVGALVFLLNPNVLYLQSTPLSELACIATMTMTGYYFLAWVQDDAPKYLVFAAGSTCLATLTRYDAWVLFPMLLVFTVLVGWLKRQPWAHIEGTLIVFGIFGGLGIGLWLLWCELIFGDPLYFQRGPYSAQTQTTLFLQTHPLETYHNLFQSLRYYLLLCVDTMGPLVLLLAALSLVVFLLRRRFAPEMLAVLVFLAPLCFYIVSLYTGQANLYIPQVVPANAEEKIFNVRFGAEMVAPVALLLALLPGQWFPKAFGRSVLLAGSYLLVGVILLQTVLIARGGVITLEDGQYGGSCAPAHQINAYLWQHYAGGLILENIFSSKIDGTEAGVDLKDFISESSGTLWKEALRDPSMVDWIIVRPGLKIDPIATHIDLNSPAFRAQFSLVVQEPDGINLYHRNGLPPLPSRPLPAGFLTTHLLCTKNSLG